MQEAWPKQGMLVQCIVRCHFSHITTIQNRLFAEHDASSELKPTHHDADLEIHQISAT